MQAVWRCQSTLLRNERLASERVCLRFEVRGWWQMQRAGGADGRRKSGVPSGRRMRLAFNLSGRHVHALP